MGKWGKIKGTALTFVYYLVLGSAVSFFLNIVDSSVLKHFFDYSILDQLKLSNSEIINKQFGDFSFLAVVIINQFRSHNKKFWP